MKVAPPTAPPSLEAPPPRPVPWRRRLPGARVLRDGTVLYWWVEIIAILVFYLVYSRIRNANGNDPGALRGG